MNLNEFETNQFNANSVYYFLQDYNDFDFHSELDLCVRLINSTFICYVLFVPMGISMYCLSHCIVFRGFLTHPV